MAMVNPKVSAICITLASGIAQLSGDSAIMQPRTRHHDLRSPRSKLHVQLTNYHIQAYVVRSGKMVEVDAYQGDQQHVL